MRGILRAFCFLLSLGFVQIATAQVTFTINTTANPDAVAQGYTSGNPYTFVLTTGASFSNNGVSTFTGPVDSWTESSPAHDSLWASVSGTGLTGSYVRPTSLPLSWIRTYSSPALNLQASDDFPGGTIGLSTLGSTAIAAVNVSISSPGAAPAFTNVLSYTPLNTFFPTYAGTYSAGFTSLDVVLLTDGNEDPLGSFQITSFTIAVSGVPEPSAYAALAGLAALGMAIVRRGRLLRT